MLYQVPQNINPNKVFLVNFSKLEGRLDPLFYGSSFTKFFNHPQSARLKHVCLGFSSGFGAGKEEQAGENNGYVQIRPTNIDNDGFLKYDKNVYVPFQRRVSFVKKRTVLFNNTNSQEWVGKTAIFLDEIQSYTSNHITSIVVDEAILNPEYLWILLNVYQRNKVFYSICTNWNNQSGVGLDLLQSIRIPVLSLADQQRVVDCYNSAYNEKHQKDLQAETVLNGIDAYLLNELGVVLPGKETQSLKDRMFIVNFIEVSGGRFDPKLYSAPIVHLKQSLFKSPFNDQPLKDFIKSSCSGEWGKDESEEVDDNKYTKCLVIRATEFDNTYNLRLENSRAKYRWIENSKLSRMNIQANDLLIEKSGGSEDQPVGRISILTDEILTDNRIAYSNFIHKISVEGINPMYLYFYLKTMHNIGITDAMQSQTNGIRNLIMSEYFNQTIVVPPLSKQQEIATHISEMKAKAKQLQTEGAEILKQAKNEVEQMILVSNS